MADTEPDKPLKSTAAVEAKSWSWSFILNSIMMFTLFQIKIMTGNLGQNEAAPARGWHATSVGTIDSTVEHVKTQATNHFNDLLDSLELDACRQKDPARIKKPRPDVFLACWRGRVLKRDVMIVSRPNLNPRDQSINPILLRLIYIGSLLVVRTARTFISTHLTPVVFCQIFHSFLI